MTNLYELQGDPLHWYFRLKCSEPLTGDQVYARIRRDEWQAAITGKRVLIPLDGMERIRGFRQ